MQQLLLSLCSQISSSRQETHVQVVPSFPCLADCFCSEQQSQKCDVRQIKVTSEEFDMLREETVLLPLSVSRGTRQTALGPGAVRYVLIADCWVLICTTGVEWNKS